jgi:hypothetical protein
MTFDSKCPVVSHQDEDGVAWGAYGLAMEGGTARQGQGWLEGSDAEFLGLTRVTLERRFPVPECGDDQPSDLPFPGMIHVRGQRDSWIAVHSFRPRFSAARHVPMWACVRIGSRQFGMGMLLAPAVRSLVQLRKDMDAALCGAEGWIADRRLEAGPPPDVQDFRALCALADEPIGQRLDIWQDTLWRGVQLQIEAVADLIGRERVALVVMIDGAPVPTAGEQDQAWILEATTAGSKPMAVEPVTCGRIADSEMVARLGVREVVRSGIQAAAIRPSGHLADRVTVPLELRPIGEISLSESAHWASAVWRAGLAVPCMRELHKRMSIGAGPGIDAALLAELLSQSPSARSGDPVGLSKTLRSAGVCGLG